jgi:hypothetical protein
VKEEKEGKKEKKREEGNRKRRRRREEEEEGRGMSTPHFVRAALHSISSSPKWTSTLSAYFGLDLAQINSTQTPFDPNKPN